MSEGNGDDKKIKVVDRRWFTEDGSLRDDRPKPKPAEPGEPRRGEPPRADAPAPQRREPSPGKAADVPVTSPLFAELVEMLAQQAALLLNGAPGYPAQPAEAQRLIDYLGMLEQKTRGNLSLEEQQMLSNLLFQLRSLFVQAKR